MEIQYLNIVYFKKTVAVMGVIVFCSCNKYGFGQNIFAFWNNNDERAFMKFNASFVTFSYVGERYDFNWETRTCPIGKNADIGEW